MSTSCNITVPPVDGIRPHFALARVAKGMLFLSGQLPFGTDNTVAGEDIAEQTHICFANIQKVLADYSLNLADIIKVTIWLARVEDFPAFNRAYATLFPHPNVPARSTVRADLMVANALIEIEAIAVLKEETK